MNKQTVTTGVGNLCNASIDYIEFYVGNAHQAAHFYRSAFGFVPIGYAGLETGRRESVSYVVEQHDIRLMFTTSLSPDSPIAEHVKRHGDGIKDIAFRVDDARAAFDAAVKLGASPVMEPAMSEDQNGSLTIAVVSTIGDTVHSLIQRDKYQGEFLPNFLPISKFAKTPSSGLQAIDHIAIGVEQGSLDQEVDFYVNALGFQQSHQEDVYTEYSAMKSKVVQNHSGRIRFPIMEPAPGKRKSQVEEYLSYYGGPGAQHVAFASDDITSTVRTLKLNGIEFLSTPEIYYQQIENRIGKIDEDLDSLRDLNILVDRDADGYLLQLFSRPIQSRPTVFVEIIQRKGSRGFGSGNIKALFEAVEFEQSKRQNL